MSTLTLIKHTDELKYLSHRYEPRIDGLAHCIECGGTEAELLDSCPGVQLTPEQHQWNFNAFMRKHKKSPHAHT